MDDLVKEAGGAGKFQVMMTAALKVGGEQACDDHITFDESVKTVVNEWSLVCDLSYVKPLMTLQMVGVLLGAFLGGQASDTIGRRLTVYLTSLFHVVACVVAAFSVSWEMFMAMRVVIGVTLGVFLVASFSYPLEFVNPKWRQVSGAGNVTVPYFGDREQGDSFVPESARWLAAKGRLEEAEAVVERVARVNGRPKPNDTLSRLRAVAEEERQAGQGRRYTYLDVFSLSFSYYGISFGVSGLSGNVYLNIFLMTIIDIPPNFSTVFLTNSRNLGYGASNTMSRIGGALAPVLLNMDTTAEVVRGYIVVGFLMAASGLACLLLRETKGQGLQDTIATKRVKDEEKDQVKAGWPSQSDVTGHLA
nr:hypothetical protein BaRGS_017293 [Batillaria attramentaria]